MTDGIIPTSTWSHNCGMHVIADFLSEKLQQNNYKTVFTGQAYDALLKSFQDVYQQKDLTWEDIRKSSFNKNRTELQIIWGYALRMILPTAVAQNAEYQQDFFHSFLAAINLYKQDEIEELQSTYPILLVACEDYFQSEALNTDVAPEKYLHYWNEKGFKAYCDALIVIPENSDKFLWLSKEELNVFCKHFNIKHEFVDHATVTTWHAETLYFANKDGAHWERKIANDNTNKALEPTIPAPPVPHSVFYEHFLTKNSEEFSQQLKIIGELFFSDLYSDIELRLALYENIEEDNLRKILIRKDIKALTEYAKNNRENEKTLENILEFSVVYFGHEELTNWLKLPETTGVFSDVSSRILLGTVKYKKQEIFNQLLNKHPEAYDSSVFMPALILAAKLNNDVVVNRLLAHSDFDQDSFMSKAVSYVKPAFTHALNQFDENNVPALYYAIQNNNLSLASTLLEKGACATYKVRDRIAFEWALDTANLDMIDLFINTVSPHQLLKLYNHEGNNCFHLCFKNKALGTHLHKWTELYLNHDHHNSPKDVFNAPNRQGLNILHLSAVEGYLEGIEYCLEHQMSLFSQDTVGNTAFHFAAACGQLEMLKSLVEKLKQYNEHCLTSFQMGDLDQKNREGITALNFAYAEEHYHIVDYLKSQGCVDIFQDATDDFTKNIFSPAFDPKVFVDKHKKAALLADCGKNTLLHYVCAKYDNTGLSQKLIRELISLKVNVQAKNKQGLTPLHMAAKGNHVQAIAELLEQGAFVDFITPTGLSACHFAAMHDNKEAFLLLKDKGASLTLKAYPKAAEQLIFNLWDGQCPLTPIQLAQYHPEKKVYHYLEENHLVPKTEIDYQSTSHWLLNKAEDKLGLTNHYFSSAFAETYEVEKTTIYKIYSSGKIIITPLCKIPFGLGAVGIEATKQALFYGYPILAGKTDRFYYYLKPVFHNYTPSMVSTGFDYLSMAGSAALYSPFTIMNAFDLAENTGRRALGLSLSLGLLKSIQMFNIKNKEIQALAYIAGKELGFALADGYHETSPEKKAYKAATQNNLNSTLNHSYEIWTSLLGKARGEQLVYTANYIHECQMAFYENVGDLERKILPELSSFREILNSTSEFFLGNKPGTYISENTLVADIDYYLNLFVTKRDDLLFNLEKVIAQNVFSDSDYQQLVLSQLHKMQGIIYVQKLEETKAKLILAEESGQTDLVEQLKIDIAKLEQSAIEANNLAKTFYEKTPKGKKSAKYNALKKQAFNSEYEIYLLNQLSEYNSDKIIDTAQEALGEEHTIDEIVFYLETILNNQGIEIEPKDLEKFKKDLNLDNLKNRFREFSKDQFNNHILNKKDFIHEKYQQDSLSLKEIESEFKGYASPEELKVLEVSNNHELKTKQFDTIMIDNQEINHAMALKKTIYFDFIKNVTEKEQAAQNHAHLKTQCEEVKVIFEEEIFRITESYEKEIKEYKFYQDKLNFDPIFKKVNENIKDGTEGKNARKEAVNIIMDALASTGLISRTVAERQYRHDFYESLKNSPENLESEIKIVFEKARNEILSPRRIILETIDKEIFDCNLKINQAMENVESARVVLNKKTSQAQISEERVLLKLKPEQHSDFKEFSINIKENITALYQLNQAFNEQGLIELKVDVVLDTKDRMVAVLNDKQIKMEKLNNFNYSEADLWTAVKKAFDDSLVIERDKIYSKIFKYLVEKRGLPNDPSLMTKLFENKDPQNENKKTIKAVYNRLIRGLDELKEGYIDEQKIIMRNDIKELEKKIQHLNEKLETYEKNVQTAKFKVEFSKNDYFEKLTAEEQARFQEKLDLFISTKEQEKHTQLQSSVTFSQAHINHQKAVEEWKNPAHVIGVMAKDGFKLHKDRKKLAEYLADEMIKLHQSLYPDIEDLSLFKMDRDTLVDELYTYKLRGHERNPNRAKKRFYDFSFAKISHTKEKRHHHRIERVTKPFINEISSELIGYKPFKDFHGGEDKSGRPGIQFNYNQNGANNVQFVSSERPVATLYHSASNSAVQAATTEMLNNAHLQEINNARSEKHLSEIAERNFNLEVLKNPTAPGSQNNGNAWQNTQHVPTRAPESPLGFLPGYSKLMHSETSLGTSSVPQSLPIATVVPQPHIPSLANSAFQGGVFGEAPQNFPGPYSSENLPEEVKNPQPKQVFVPFGYQNTNTQPVIAPLPAEQQPRFTSTSSAPGYQNNGNMINSWQNTQHVPTRVPENPLGFLPGYSKLMHSETSLGTSSVPQSLPIETVVPQPHIPSLANSVFQGGVFEKNPPSLPGPLRSEGLSEEVKNPQPRQASMSIGPQEVKQPVVPLRAEEQAIHEVSKPTPSTQNQPIKEPEPVVFSKTAQAVSKSNQNSWSQSHDKFIGNPQSAATLLGPRAPIQVSADFLNSLIPQMGASKVSVMQLPGLMWDGLTESGKDLFDGVISLAEFTGREAIHLVKGEELETVQAAALLKQFIGEEASRYALGQKLESARIAKELVRNFQELSHKDKIKGGIKLYLSIVVEPVAMVKGAMVAQQSAKQIAHMTKGALQSNMPVPVRFSPVSKSPTSMLVASVKMSDVALKSRYPQFELFRKLTSESLNKLALPVDQGLIQTMKAKGWRIDVAKPGTDDWKWLTMNDADASFNTGVKKHMLIKENAPKSAILEEFLHGTQNDLKLIDKYGSPQALEVHVKEFMLRHAKMLGLDNPNDIRLLQQLKVEEIDRLRNAY